MEILLRPAAFAVGATIVVQVLLSAIRAFILPKAYPDPLVHAVFVVVRRLFDLRLRHVDDYADRDRLFSYYAPVSLVLLPFLWLGIAAVGFAMMLWSVDPGPLWETFRLSGSSITTLGFANAETPVATIIVFVAAAIGLFLVAVLISYLPTIYSAYSVREQDVALLMVRAGRPPSAVGMIDRYHRLGALDRLDEQWVVWERWFALLAETHTSLSALNYYRSPRSEYTWVTAAGTILDAVAILTSAVDVPRSPQRELCLRSGYLALREIGDYFEIPYDPSPRPGDQISVTREEFEAAIAELAAEDVPIQGTADERWADFTGWRVNYDHILIVLAELTMAPPAQWISDRSPIARHRPSLQRRRPRHRR